MRVGNTFIVLAIVLGVAPITVLGQPSVNIKDSTVIEGSSGRANVSFQVTLSAPASGDVTVSYSELGVTATQGATCSTFGVDFNPFFGTVTIPAGATSGVGGIPVCGDTTDEPDETFRVSLGNLSGPPGVTLGNATADITITDDDEPGAEPPRPSVEDVQVEEGNAMIFTVRLSAPATERTEVRLEVLPTLATQSPATIGAALGCSGSFDLIAQSPMPLLIFAPGATTATTIGGTIIACEDNQIEPDETFQVTVRRLFPNPDLSNDIDFAFGTIRNDDFAGVRISDATIVEGQGTARFIVQSSPHPDTLTINLTTQVGRLGARSGTACGRDVDYVAPGPITMGPSSSDPEGLQKAVNVTICDDAISELTERATFVISPAAGLTILDGEGVLTIQDND